MNYYIEGNPDKAEHIKAAFEKRGYDIPWPGGCANPDVINIGVERNGAKYVVAETSEYIKEIIKTHPDYKELELHIEPNFKAGDWLYHNTCGVRPILVMGYDERKGYQVECVKTKYELQRVIVEKEYHHWTIQDAKDGDVLHLGCIIAIFKKYIGREKCVCYCSISEDGDFEIPIKNGEDNVYGCTNTTPAIKEQRELLFAKMKEAGYEWDADKKELRKIQPHYDIANFKPKQWVLVRDDDEWEWALTRFSHLSNGSASLFVCINGASFQQCIPFDGNENLLGTSDMCDEKYVNWQ